MEKPRKRNNKHRPYSALSVKRGNEIRLAQISKSWNTWEELMGVIHTPIQVTRIAREIFLDTVIGPTKYIEI